MITITKKALYSYLVRLFTAARMSSQDAEICADVIVDAELKGKNSHGIRLMDSYLSRLTSGGINPKATLTTIKDNAAALVLDANGGMGHVAMVKGLTQSIPKARENGSCSLGIRNANHFGHAGYYAAMVAHFGMIGMIMSNSTPVMSAWGGLDLCLGTNPIAFGIPGKDEPIVLDMASSLMARGKIIVAASLNKKIPEGVALDKHGNPTTVAQEAVEGIVLPDGHKGYGLALIIDILAGVLTGSQFGVNIVKLAGNSTQSQNIGFFTEVINIADFMDICEFVDKIQEIKAFIHNSRRQESVSELFLPGEHSAIEKRFNEVKGIEIPEAVWETLKMWEEKLRL
jgi:LDH2 family malate/lactate/ureidoglycolate dehydrogenase